MNHLKKYSFFYIPYSLFVVVVTIVILTNDKAALHLWLTSFYTPIGDIFFRYYTEVGGNIPFLIVGVFMFYRYRIALFLLITQLVSGLVVHIMKRLWDEPRPISYFSEKFPAVELHAIVGVPMHTHNSFPSGHTTSAFALFLSILYFSKKPPIHFLCFLLAVLVGFSRVYLSQHFILDLLVGSIIGVSVSISCNLYLDRFSMKWADGSLRDVFSRK